MSAQSVPGGGSASAIVAELSAALLHMACSISNNSLDINDRNRNSLELLLFSVEGYIQNAGFLSELDELAYINVSRAFKLPASTPEEREIRKDIINKTCLEAAEIPCKVIKLAYDIFLLAKDALPYINDSLMSDLAIVVTLVQAAGQSALYLVHANLPYLDKEDAQRVYQRANKCFNNLSKEAKALQGTLDETLLNSLSDRRYF